LDFALLVHTFKYKQSSLIGFSGIKYSLLQTMNGLGSPCIGLALNAVQTLTSFHGATGCGAFQRNAPMGGAANGMPLYTSIFPR